MNRLSFKNNGASGSSFFPLTRQSLIARLNDRSKTESEKAWDEFFAIYSPLIYRMARHEGLGTEASEEVVAVVMRNFASSIRSGFNLRTRFRNYLRTVTNRQIRREKQGKRGQLTLRDSEHSVVTKAVVHEDAEWERVEREERWRVCLERVQNSPAIRPRDWAAFESLVIRGEPAKSVAKRYGVTPNRLYGIKHKIISELRRLKLKLDIELGEV